MKQPYSVNAVRYMSADRLQDKKPDIVEDMSAFKKNGVFDSWYYLFGVEV